MGKGSGRRPRQISAEEEQRRWDAAFGKKEEVPEVPAETDGAKVIDLMEALKDALKKNPNEEG